MGEQEEKAFGPSWEARWTRVLTRHHVMKMCQKLFPDVQPKPNSLIRCISLLREKKCFCNETIDAWAKTSGHRKDVTWDVASMQVDYEKAPQSLLGKKRGYDSILSPSTNPPHAGDGMDLSSPVQEHDAEEEVLSSSEEEEDATDRYTKRLSEFKSLGELVHDLQAIGLGTKAEKSLDSRKVDFLAELFPADVALNRPLKTSERQKYLAASPMFDFLPQARKHDFSDLSSKLNRSEKEHIKCLYQAQLRVRQLLRITTGHMYVCVDVSKSFKDQSALFHQWNSMLELQLDEFVWLIKQQQQVIVKKAGMSDVLDMDNGSIIPLELKQKLKEVSDFQRHFGTGRFSRRWNSGQRGRGSNGFTPSRFYGTQRFGSGRSISSFRSTSPFRSSGSNSFANSQFSGSSYRGRSRGRGHTKQ